MNNLHVHIKCLKRVRKKTLRVQENSMLEKFLSQIHVRRLQQQRDPKEKKRSTCGFFFQSCRGYVPTKHHREPLDNWRITYQINTKPQCSGRPAISNNDLKHQDKYPKREVSKEIETTLKHTSFIHSLFIHLSMNQLLNSQRCVSWRLVWTIM